MKMDVDQFKNATILVVGDVMRDVFVKGRVERVSPEAPALVLRVEGEHSCLGGAANVATNVVALGGKAIVCGTIGDDEAGRSLVSDIRGTSAAIEAATVVSARRPTTTKTRFIAGDRHLLRADWEEVVEDREADDAIVRLIGDLAPRATAIVISDYLKGVVTERVMEAARQAAARHGLPLVVDPKRHAFSFYHGATVLTPNVKELEVFAGGKLESDAEQIAAARRAQDETGGASILLTRSEKGVSLHVPGQEVWLESAHARKVVDVSGAGDTVTAAVALSLASGFTLQDAAGIANMAGSIAVEKPGTSPVSGQELYARMLTAENEIIRKLATVQAARTIREAWRANGLKVGLTNGCFDLLHPGHIQLLEQAKSHCDKLIVALNTDASVSRLKGPTRPIQSELARATVMGAIGAVDLVVFFDDDTPLDLIRAILPDLLFKGSDYAIGQVVGAEDVIAAGGEVKLVDLVQGQSTTRLVARSATN
jgi:D-beta-D-heptose 7-phosphate kinase / D-beta-D-heptose 1-phosphate adenosyltransferase